MSIDERPEQTPPPPPAAASPPDPWTGGGDPAAAPYEAAAKPPKSSPGCVKPLLIGCGLLLVLVLAAAVFLFTKRFDVVAWMFEQFQTAAEASIDESVDAERRERLSQAFDAAIAAARSGDFDMQALQKTQEVFGELGQRSSFDESDVDEWIAVLERFAASGSKDVSTLRGPPAGVSSAALAFG